MNMDLLILKLLFGMLGIIKASDSNEQSILHENVLFHKTGQISLSRSRWLLTLLIDFSVYENFIKKLNYDIKNASALAEIMLRNYDAPNEKGYLNVFKGLKLEITSTEEMIFELQTSFANLRSLNILKKPRPKRALLPFLGAALNNLVGTITEADLATVRGNIKP